MERVACSPKEFAAALGHHPSWAYRLLYKGKVKSIVGLGEILIPLTELERILASATTYNPDKATYRRPGRPHKAQKKNGENAADAQPQAADSTRRDSGGSSMSAGKCSTRRQQKT